MAPVSLITSATTASRSVLVEPEKWTCAFCACVPAILDGVEMCGMTMWAGMEKVRAARARACAWFPGGNDKKKY